MTQEEGQDQDQDDDQLPSQFAEEPMSPLTSRVAGGRWLHKTSAANRSIGSTTGCTITEKALLGPSPG